MGQRNGIIYFEDITSLIDTSVEVWKQYIDSDENEEVIENIRKHTLLGRPLGTTAFIAKLGKKAGRVLSVLPRGQAEEAECE